VVSLGAKKRLTMGSHELPQLRRVLGTNWARGKSLFELALGRMETTCLQSGGTDVVERRWCLASRE
jgi:hypothetical protein